MTIGPEATEPCESTGWDLKQKQSGEALWGK